MNIILIVQAIILGIIEGLTEFIPVSSTGHLILLIEILKFNAPPGQVFEIVIQLGAILAICWHYKRKLCNVVFSVATNKESQKFSLNIILAFLPAAILGVLFHSQIKEILFDPLIVAIMLVVGGVVILIVENMNIKSKYNNIDKITPFTALMIGFAQSVAMIPGTSRSGATIIGSLLLKLDRKTATEFSFFLAIPTMLGATIYDIYKNYEHMNLDNSLIIAIGFISAFLSALLVVKTVIGFVSNNGFKIFAYYRIVIGIILLVIFGLNN